MRCKRPCDSLLGQRGQAERVASSMEKSVREGQGGQAATCRAALGASSSQARPHDLMVQGVPHSPAQGMYHQQLP
jgi:hypothetical protein